MTVTFVKHQASNDTNLASNIRPISGDILFNSKSPTFAGFITPLLNSGDQIHI